MNLRGVSAVGYYSNGQPYSTGQYVNSSDAGGTATAGWSKFRPHRTLNFNYTASYLGSQRSSLAKALNHAVNLTATEPPALNFTFSAAADVNTDQQALFASGALGTVAATPSTFDELAAGVVGSNSSNAQVTNALASAGSLNPAVRTLLYGQWVFTGTAQATASYAYSSRFSIAFGGEAPAEPAPGAG